MYFLVLLNKLLCLQRTHLLLQAHFLQNCPNHTHTRTHTHTHTHTISEEKTSEKPFSFKQVCKLEIKRHMSKCTISYWLSYYCVCVG